MNQDSLRFCWESADEDLMHLFSESRPGIWTKTLADGGPLYSETQLEQVLVEPFNAFSALLFLGLAGHWAWKLRGRYRQNLFFSFCIFLLALGGVGGALYHGTRSSRVFHLMDVFAILALCVALGIYLWGQVLGERRWAKTFAIVLPMLAPLPLGYLKLPSQAAVSFSYVIFSAIVLAPTYLYLRRTHFRQGGLVLTAILLFLGAFAFRVADSFHFAVQVLPMGTHWLWHLCSLGSTALLLTFFFRVTQSATDLARVRPRFSLINQEHETKPTRQRI